ncbi:MULTISPECIES: SDR family NAD(P)-dependent oxidoreductase [Sphingobium]|jgi:NAD(P)-dependent dehydrogenase (short-subunit alcohol dehydrogenase family)|uniref:SDR family NAD(P)-dependent oxidoreductase n=1 Tax=Sphingobium TaxID=165695 RepID=UPI0007F3F450|nr:MULTISPECIES: SDR family NAD(P)-dependent oxidoreductase [Sphingobium]MBS48936.1 short-chain dehydrogenase [Sphingobium sp.]MCC4256259.1 SDR family NAD(P)-dependent oxidoreductase [Sphingobium lactosutens]OAN58217.1 short-chain dehydrogenase [Sphingobium sp. TCM1]HCW62038.1 KR domain-containing protein [Sphingobium sp.]|tara:strand:- start:1466 stop:2242 length:777 start_codon:yes stop_codon:yes gene_type:complete
MTAAPIFDLTGRVALVTGASSGLGERFAHILSDAGAAVVLAARRTERLEATRTAIEAKGGRAIAVAMDVADEASTIAAYDAAEGAFGTVDTIIANAGMNSEGMTTELPVAEFDRVMAVNLRGPFLTAREGARRLIAAGSPEKQHGRIVITSSITAHKVDAGLAVYSGSKAGVLQMGRVMARDWIRKGINVNMICPGYIKTEINGEWFDTDAGERQIQKFHRRRLMEEGDLDSILLFLASDASRAVTGTHFTIDDGQSL